VIDTSGSMAEAGGKKMEQAKKALSFCLQNLNERDRFEVIRFSTEAEPLFDGLKAADKANVEKAQTFVQSLKPIGGTAIEDALKKAMAVRSAENRPDARPYVVIFLTDGQPTIGETNEDKLLDAVAKSNTASTRIFSFGIGTDVNTHLLDRVASTTKAVSQYVLPEEDLEVKLSSFYSKIKDPVLSNVQVSFAGGDVRTSQVYPGELPDLFKGEVLLAFGRYSGKGPAAVKVSGTLNGERREFTTDVKFADHDVTNAYIPKLWATRRVGWLLDEIRLRGQSSELKDEVTKLAREHGIVTPYTAYLIMEDERRRDVPVVLRNFRELDADGLARGAVRDRFEGAAEEARDVGRRSGAGAVANARDIGALKSNQSLDELASAPSEALSRPSAGPVAAGISGQPATAAPAGGYRQPTNYAQQSRVVNGRAFYQNEDVWTDSTAQSNKNARRVEIAFGSDAYFALLKEHSAAAPWLALGEKVDVMLGDTLYVVR
jgi:Ca-activated chloride channel family protein